MDQPGDIVITGTANPPIYPLTFEIVGDIPGMNSFSQNQRQQFISGTPTTPGNYTFTVRATNEAGIVGQRAYTLSVVGFTTDALPGATAGEPYEAFILTTGMAGNLTWGIAYGSLPDGLILNSTTGAIFGIADTIGDYSFSIFVQNGVQQCFKEFEISVTNCFSSPSPTLTDATQYVLASYQMVPVESPEAGFVWNYTIVSGSIPTGMSLGLTTGLLSGTPTASGDFLFTVEITQVPI